MAVTEKPIGEDGYVFAPYDRNASIQRVCEHCYEFGKCLNVNCCAHGSASQIFFNGVKQVEKHGCCDNFMWSPRYADMQRYTTWLKRLMLNMCEFKYSDDKVRQ